MPYLDGNGQEFIEHTTECASVASMATAPLDSVCPGDANAASQHQPLLPVKTISISATTANSVSPSASFRTIGANPA